MFLLRPVFRLFIMLCLFVGLNLSVSTNLRAISPHMSGYLVPDFDHISKNDLNRVRSDSSCAEIFHNLVSRANYQSYMRVLSEANNLLKNSDLNIPLYNEESIIRGEKSILSIGEGNALFIITLLEKRSSFVKNSEHIKNIHALDIIYNKKLAGYNRNSQLQANYGDNFHGMNYLSFDLVDRKGKRILFDEMISSHSLSYVIEDSTYKHRKIIFSRIVSHLADGAVIRIWPIRKTEVFKELLLDAQFKNQFSFYFLQQGPFKVLVMKKYK